MRKLSIVLAGVAGVLSLSAGVAQATPITFSDSVIASGMFGGNAFTNALVTFTGTGDTDNVLVSPGFFEIQNLPLSVTVAGLGSATVTDNIQVVANAGSTDIGFGDNSVGAALMFVLGDLGGYNLQGNFTLTGSTIINVGDSYGTSAGAFSFSGAADTATFTAELGRGGNGGSVPEPAAWALMIAGFGLTGAALRRRDRVIA